MIYLSQLHLNPTSRMVQRELANPYQLHRTLLRGFNAARATANVLHHVEIHPRTGIVTVLVQSNTPPDWTPLQEVGQGRYLLQPPQTKRVEVQLPAGKRLRFRLRANPTIKKARRDPTTGERRHSNRVPLVREDKQTDWLLRQGAQHGFRLLEVAISQSHTIEDWVGRAEKRERMTLYTVQFEGILEITHAERFQHAWRNGIGPAKAFGCGLLALAPG